MTALEDAVAAAFRTMIVPMRLPPDPDCPNQILEYLERRVLSNNHLCWPCGEIRALTEQFCWLQHSNNFTASNIHHSLKSIAPGQVRVIYIAAQNAVLLLHRSLVDKDKVEVYAWAAQLPPGEIFKSTDEPLRYRIPESAVIVNFSRLTETKTFSSLLYDLGVNPQPEALPSTSRAGESVVEERGTTHPMFVTEWLLRTLGGDDISSSQEKGNALSKKVRDEAYYGNGKLLWRRCPIWFALRSAAHFATRLMIGSYDDPKKQAVADLSFKLWVTDIIGTLYSWDSATRTKHYSSLELKCGKSALLEGARKLARRVEKLKQKSPSDIWTHLNGKAVEVRCEQSANHAVDFLKSRESNLDEPALASMRLLEHEVQAGLVHQLKHSWPTIQHLKDSIENGNKQGSLQIGLPPAIRRNRPTHPPRNLAPSDLNSLTKALNEAMARDAPREIIAALRDVCDNVMQEWKLPTRYNPQAYCDKNSDVSFLSESLLELLRANLEVSAKFGQGDVRLESIHTILISVTVVLLLDRLNCELFPMLKEHKLGMPVGNDKFLNALCLAKRSEKEHLLSLEEYIHNRNEAHGRVFVSRDWSSGSFPTRFASKCPKMDQVRSDIQARCQRNVAEKVDEYKRERSRYDRLTRQVNSSSCGCDDDDDDGFLVTCNRCRWVNERSRINIYYYERLLPPEENDQLAVVYELTEPIPLSCLRESLYLTATKILDDPGTVSTPYHNNIYKWKDDNRLSLWNISRSSPLSLSSTRKPWCQTHYSYQHVAAHHSFVVDSEKNCTQTRITSEGKAIIRDIDSWSWSLLKKCSVQLDQQRYQALQEYVCGWQHNEDQVICAKSEAHYDKKVASVNIPLSEFEAVGKLRAGHRLQIERFLGCLSQRSVSFRENDVVTTAMALFWQVAPNSTGQWHRDCWKNLVDSDNHLVEDCVRHSQELLEDARENWDDHNVLLLTTLFLRAVFEHCPPNQGQNVARVLRMSREIAKDWIEKIREATDRCTQEKDVQALLTKCAAVASIGVLTFLDHYLLMMHDDIKDFLHLRAVARDNQSINALREHSWQRQHHIHADTAAEAVLERCHRLIREKPTCLDDFLQIHWGKAITSSGFQTCWRRYREAPASDSWYHSKFMDRKLSQQCKLEIDVLGRLFLIDGKPCKRLPESITSHALYTRLFGSSVFAVQPDGCGGFITKSTVQGARFTFRDGEIPEIEEDRNGIRSILVHDQSFVCANSQQTDDYPVMFIRDYSHWITHGSGMIYFRPKHYADDTFKSFSPNQNRGFDYTLSLKTRMTQVVKKEGWYLVDIASHAHQTLFTTVFQRLCVQPDLHVFSQVPTAVPHCNSVLAEVCLPRLQNLRFDVLKCNLSLESWNPIRATDYRGLLVARNQNFGTLRGLQQGLLLEGATGSDRQHEKRVLIMPHGKTSRPNPNPDQKTCIDVQNLREPTFFKYELRDDLCDIHPPKPRHATTYLALLHATTSGLFPDPFLGCTGTQKAISLLRSGRCCGNLTTSMEEDATKTLELETITLTDIAKLSPARQFYPANLRVMETVMWPQDLEPLCAHNGFAFLAKQRMDDMSNALKLICQTLTITDGQKDVINARTSQLSKRAMLIKSSLYPTDCNLDNAEMSRVFGSDSVVNEWTRGQGRQFNPTKGFEPSATAAISIVGYCGQNSQFVATDYGLVKCLLQASSVQTLQGWENNREGTPTGMSTCWSNVITKPTSAEEIEKDKIYTEFHNVWITLYNIARNEDIWNTAEGRMQFTFLVSFLTQRYPSNRDHLLQLLVVCKNGSAFEELNPPTYTDYQNPSDDHYAKSSIENVVEKYLEKFSESSPSPHDKNYLNSSRRWQQRKDSHNVRRQASKNAILSNAMSAWNGRRKLSSNEVNYDHVTSTSTLASKINKRLTNWSKAEELSQFTSRFHEKLSSILNGPLTSPNDIHNMTASVDVSNSEVVTSSRQFQLVTMRDHAYYMNKLKDLEVAMLNLHISSPTLTAKEILSKFSLPSTLCQSRNATTPFPLSSEDIVQGDESREMANEELAKMKKSWQLVKQSGESILNLLIVGLQLDENRTVLRSLLEDERQLSLRKYKQLISVIREMEKGPQVLETTGLWNNTSVTAILSKFLMETGEDPLTSPIVDICCRLGLAIRRAQRATRCLRLLDQGDQVYARLTRELVNVGSCGWKPLEYPEWLLLELDNDYSIRENQAQVAQELLSDNMTNDLLQLNMGEGKTDVIMPMIMARFGALAKRIKARQPSHLNDCMAELCCVTVLNSLYPSNSSTWQWRIGGILGQRVYPLLFRRDLVLGKSEAAHMLNELEYITSNGHVLVTVPEQRLSLENKLVELASPTAIHRDVEASKALLKVVRFLKHNCRHFLDESDLILSPLYQLIYTLGDPVDMDGGVLRWGLAAAALQSVSDMAAELQDKFPRLVEVHLYQKPRISTVRLLDGDGANTVWEFIRERVLDDVVSKGTATKHLEVRPKLLPEEINKFRSIVLDVDVDTRSIHFGKNSTCDKLQKCGEILRGILTHDALRFALEKRWRVDFGSHPLRLGYLMAVPYRYKDVAAERTEFKHADIMLLHTLQHYYHHGLLRSQITQVFSKLRNMADVEAKTLFNGWAKQSNIHVDADENKPRPLPLLDYTSVNCADAAQFEQQIVPQFQYHVEAIDFFLFRKVFPIQAKQFTNEISSNSWDLCPVPHGDTDTHHSDNARFPTKGFSGTDGSRPVLPATVTLKNLPSGEITNGLQMKSLLSPENNEVSILSGGDINVSQSIVNLLETKKGVNVVLDPGALILEMDNQTFAAAWLALRPDIEAVVFFNERDKECVITQTSPDEPVERIGSPYADDLSKCLIYLDDVHTRGVDFLLPLNTRAILTLGKGPDKDKLMQAAMRLRQLGPDGQSLHFVASAEVGKALKKRGVESTDSNSCENSSKILAWALSNTVKRNCDLIPYYAAQGADHLKRTCAFSILASEELTLETLAETLIQSEDLSVTNMYGSARAPELLVDVVSNNLQHFLTNDSAQCNPVEYHIALKVLTHVKGIAPEVQRLQSKFGQEMERELEQELEEEIHVERPPPAEPKVPSVSEDLLNYLKGQVSAFYPLHHGALTRTSLHDMVPGQFETNAVLVTQDFCNTIKASNAMQDGHTKTPCWVLDTGKEVIILLSNFEAEFVDKHYPSVVCGSGYPRLHMFLPLRRLRQPHCVLTRDISFKANAVLHVYSGSIQPDSDLLAQMQNYMGLVPKSELVPSIHSSSIERDGFVPPEARLLLARERGLQSSPFKKSPVEMLRKLYSDIYHIGEELATSSVGKLLGAAELGDYRG